MSKKCNDSTKCGENTKIKCEAKNCVYHGKECECTAEKINIGNPSACTESATSCETFKMKDPSCGCM